MYVSAIKSPVGTLYLCSDAQHLTGVHYSPQQGICGDHLPLHKETERQLREYFSGSRKQFDLPLCPRGTAFQLSVWKALQDIPYGRTCSYGEIAAAVGNAKACRAVGMANNRNPISIIIPCHRVIGSSGKLVGYGGGLAIKETLLALEQTNR